MSFFRKQSAGGASLHRLALEVCLVFVAVSAALFANARWQAREARLAGQAALSAFVSEIEANQAQIHDRLEHHRLIVRNSGVLLGELASGAPPIQDARQLQDRLTDSEGMLLPFLVRMAWESCLASGVVAHIPPAELRAVAGVYDLQRKLDVLVETLRANFMQPGFYDHARAEPITTALLVSFDLLVEIEVAQLEAYRTCLEQLRLASLRSSS